MEAGNKTEAERNGRKEQKHNIDVANKELTGGAKQEEFLYISLPILSVCLQEDKKEPR